MDALNRIRDIIASSEDVIWGISDIAYSDLSEKYSRAIIIAQKYSQFISNEGYDEERYHKLLVADRVIINDRINRLKELFDELGICNYVPPLDQTDEISLVAQFLFKYAAVQAGLGWIGKSGVLVTKQFGPRIRLAAILINHPLECGKPIKESLCGDCHSCIDACPWGLIKGANWGISTCREELLDYQSCNKKRSEYIDENSRKHTCGYCILACPWNSKDTAQKMRMKT